MKEKWNEDGNIKKNLKILKIVKKEKKIDDMCARLRAAGDGGSGGAEEPEVDHELSAMEEKRDPVVGMKDNGSVLEEVIICLALDWGTMGNLVR
ncbi:hypothetical protein [Rossellomorea marisflavi]|uniref:hypothetical protein n=1 Tax=Rossellomorea marisflavi TaxID=189381 RepID=UPI0034582AC1